MVKVKRINNDVRKIVIEHYKNGLSVTAIFKCLAGQVSSRSIYRWIDYYKKLGKILHKFVNLTLFKKNLQ